MTDDIETLRALLRETCTIALRFANVGVDISDRKRIAEILPHAFPSGPHHVDCVRCGAVAGMYCTDPKTHRPKMGYHVARWNAYERQRKQSKQRRKRT